jgi:hypothetical protein
VTRTDDCDGALFVDGEDLGQARLGEACFEREAGDGGGEDGSLGPCACAVDYKASAVGCGRVGGVVGGGLDCYFPAGGLLLIVVSFSFVRGFCKLELG